LKGSLRDPVGSGMKRRHVGSQRFAGLRRRGS
jgi:hypothetical protein